MAGLPGAPPLWRAVEAPGRVSLHRSHRPIQPSRIRVIDACEQVLTDAGVDDRDASLSYGAYANQVGSSAEIAAAFTIDDRGDGQRRAQFAQRLRNVAALPPGLQRALPHFESWDHVTAFAYSLDLILDGIDRRLANAHLA